MQEKLQNVIHKFNLGKPNKNGEVKISVVGWDFEEIISAKAIGDDIYVWAIMKHRNDLQYDHITLKVIPTGLKTFDRRFLKYFVATVWFENGTDLIFHIFVGE